MTGATRPPAERGKENPKPLLSWITTLDCAEARAGQPSPSAAAGALFERLPSPQQRLAKWISTLDCPEFERCAADGGASDSPANDDSRSPAAQPPQRRSSTSSVGAAALGFTTKPTPMVAGCAAGPESPGRTPFSTINAILACTYSL